MTVKTLLVKISADGSELRKELGAAESKLKAAGDGLQKTGMALTAAVSVPLMGIGIASTKMAMEAVESENLFEISMGDMAKAARTWSEQLRAQLGLNAYEVRKNVGVFYNMFQAMGLGKTASFDMATGLTQLSYDMASFYNLKPSEAFDKLQAGITGQIKPLKDLGILIDDTTVKTFAYATGMVKQGQELTEQERVMARFNLILDQTKTAQGDLARTIDSPTNQLRVMRTTVSQLATDFGMALLPAFQSILRAGKPLLDFISQAVHLFTSLPKPVQMIVIALSAAAISVGPLAMVIGKVLTLIPALAAGFTVLTGPIGIIVAAIAGLIAVGVLVVANWDKISAWLKKVWADISAYFSAVWAGIKSVFGGVITWIVDFVTASYNRLISITTKLVSIFIEAWTWLREGVSSIVKAVAEFVIDKIMWLMEQIAKIPIVKKFVQNLEEGLQAAKAAIAESHAKINESTKSAAEKTAAEGDKIKNTYKAIGTSAKAMTPEITGAYAEVVDRIKSLTLSEREYKRWALEQSYADRKRAIEKEIAAGDARNKALIDLEKAKNLELAALEKTYRAEELAKHVAYSDQIRALENRLTLDRIAASRAYEAKKRELTDSIMQMTLKELDYKLWALEQERMAELAHIVNSQDLTNKQKEGLLKIYDDYYEKKKKQIEKDATGWTEIVNLSTQTITDIFGSFLDNTLGAFQRWGEAGGSILKVFGEAFKSMVADAINAIRRLITETLLAAAKTVIAKKAEALASAIASVLKSIPFPLNLALIGGAIAAVSALFAKIKLAEGGLAMRPVTAVVGEVPELIIPLHRVKEMGMLGGNITIRQSNYFYGDMRSDQDIDEISKRLAARTIQAISKGRK